MPDDDKYSLPPDADDRTTREPATSDTTSSRTDRSGGKRSFYKEHPVITAAVVGAAAVVGIGVIGAVSGGSDDPSCDISGEDVAGLVDNATALYPGNAPAIRLDVVGNFAGCSAEQKAELSSQAEALIASPSGGAAIPAVPGTTADTVTSGDGVLPQANIPVSTTIPAVTESVDRPTYVFGCDADGYIVIPDNPPPGSAPTDELDNEDIYTDFGVSDRCTPGGPSTTYVHPEGTEQIIVQGRLLGD